MINKQIFRNLSTNIIAISFAMFINFWITPYVVNNLGINAYGYVGIINNIISFFAVLTYTLNSMVGRFFTISYKQGNLKDASEYISSALFVCILMVLCFLPIIIGITFNLEHFIVINNTFTTDMKITFFFSCIAFFLSTISAVMSTGAYSCNRLEINNGINILSNLIKMILILGLFALIVPKIWFISIGAVIQSIVTVILGACSFKLLIPEIKFKIKNFRLHKAYELLSAGAFNSIILLGTTLMTEIDLLVGNKFLNAKIVGEYAVLLLFSFAIRSIASAISSAFSPTTLEMYAKGSLNELKEYSNSVVKFCGLLIGWPISIIAGIGISFIQLWLNKDFSQYSLLIICMTIPLASTLAILQLNVLCQAVNMVKVPAMATILAGLINIVLAIISVSVLKLGLWGVVLSSVFSLTFRNLFFMPIYVSKITNQVYTAYYNGLYKPTIIVIFVCLAGLVLRKKIMIDSMIEFFITCFGLSILYFIGAYFLLSFEEKCKLRHSFKRFTSIFEFAYKREL